MAINVLAFSSSRVGNGGYLETAVPLINRFLGNKPLSLAFIPFALVNHEYEGYADNVRKAFGDLPYRVQPACEDKAKTIIETADVIMTGGGNTFKLLHDLYALDLLELIRTKVQAGIPYIGWSAGSNVAGAGIYTSNDMPIIQPQSFTALTLLPFQVNPHYYNMPIAGFNGETRDQRLNEFVQLNPGVPVVALPEGTALLRQDKHLTLKGGPAFIFGWEQGQAVQRAVEAEADLSFLLQ